MNEKNEGKSKLAIEMLRYFKENYKERKDNKKIKEIK